MYGVFENGAQGALAADEFSLEGRQIGGDGEQYQQTEVDLSAMQSLAVEVPIVALRLSMFTVLTFLAVLLVVIPIMWWRGNAWRDR